MTSGLAATAAAMLSWWAAPLATSGAAFAGLRFHTVVGCPAAKNASASALPMEPSPTMVTGVLIMLPTVEAGIPGDKYLLICQVLTKK